MGYCAPERLESDCKYTNKVDLWGAGLVLFEMLIGKHPFNMEDGDEAVKQIREGESIVSEILLEHAQLSEEVKTLIKNLVRNDPDVRLSATDALNSKWITSEGLC